MKNYYKYYAAYGIILAVIFTAVSFITPDGSNLFNMYSTSFFINLILIDLCILLQSAGVCYYLYYTYKNKTVNKNNSSVFYSTIAKSAVLLLTMLLIGVIVSLLAGKWTFIATIAVYLILIYNIFDLIKVADNADALKKALNKKSFKYALLPSVVVILTASLIITLYLIPNFRYNKAVALAQSGEAKQAIIEFAKSNGYRDSADKINELAAADQTLKIYAAGVGDTVSLGKYEQDNNLENGTEAIEWTVLETYKNKKLLISKDCLDAVPYNTVLTNITWADCSLRVWLNNDFYNTAFDNTEKSLITSTKLQNNYTDFGRANIRGGKSTVDNVFLLSIDEANKYLPREYAFSKATPYAIERGAYRNAASGYCWWWLRSPGANASQAARANINEQMTEAFSAMGMQVNATNQAIRPCIWIDITK